MQDWRPALKLLWKDKTFTLTAVLTLPCGFPPVGRRASIQLWRYGMNDTRPDGLFGVCGV